MNPEYVIDANVLFSAFISGKEIYQILFSEKKIYLPDFTFLEIEKYKERILKKTRLKEDEFKEFVIKLLMNVTVVPNFLISQESLKEAYILCQSIDEKDTVYIALAIEFHLILITNDRRLYNGLKKQHFHNIILLEEVIENEKLII
jgi:predicted nucleic acid-binding protein